jgi:tetratricopeptide (TPR) repeat protein
MIARNVPKNAFEESLRLLLNLHELTKAGDSETPKADSIRDAMEAPWYAMTESEQRMVRRVSADLDTTLDENTGHSRTTDTLDPEIQPILLAKLRGNSPEQVLDLIDAQPHRFSLRRATMLRGLSYEKLGLHNVALAFFEFAAQLEGWSGEATTKLLSLLDGDGDTDEAIKLARQFVSRAESPLDFLLLYTSHLLVKVALRSNPETGIPLLNESMSYADRGIRLSHPSRLALATGSLHGIAVGYWHFGENVAAVDALKRAVRLMPTDAVAYSLLGIIKESLSDPTAIHEFERAIRYGSEFVWPYARLAFKALLDGQFQECRQLCQVALKLAKSDVARANLLEWMAIASFESGEPADLTRDLFLHALRLTPENDRIQKNFETFEAFVQAGMPASSAEMSKEESSSVFDRNEIESHFTQFAFA